MELDLSLIRKVDTSDFKIRPLVKKWVSLRQMRIQNQVILLNHRWINSVKTAAQFRCKSLPDRTNNMVTDEE